MRRRALRVVLFVLLAAALSAAAVFVAREEAASASWRSAAADFEVEAARFQHALADVRTGQLALSAPGQADTWWRNTLAASFERTSASLELLQRTGTDAVAREQLTLARGALETLGEVGARAAEMAGSGEREQAAAVVLTEGLRAAATVSDHVETARQAEARDFDVRLAELRDRQAYAAGGAGVLALLVGLLLVPAGAARKPVSVDALPRAADATAPARLVAALPATTSESREPAADVRIDTASSVTEAPAAQPMAFEAPRHAPAPVVTAPLAPPPPATDAPVAAPAAAPDSSEAWPARDRRKAPELRAAADLCTDFARLLDSQELPALLERAARLLDATGLIVWVADPSQQELRPLLAHGYTAQALARLPTIPRGADNATAAAFRDAEVEVVRTNGMSPGAVVVPLLAAQGCLGVMAAEVRHGREASESARALARIVAAQLATLVSIVPAEEATEPLPKHAAQ
jgi:hypothetical protein